MDFYFRYKVTFCILGQGWPYIEKVIPKARDGVIRGKVSLGGGSDLTLSGLKATVRLVPIDF